MLELEHQFDLFFFFLVEVLDNNIIPFEKLLGKRLFFKSKFLKIRKVIGIYFFIKLLLIRKIKNQYLMILI